MSRVKTMTARYAGRCVECGGGIQPGDTINYGGRGATTHGGCRPVARVHTPYGSRVYGGYENTGSRCEDAPCCGCC